MKNKLQEKLGQKIKNLRKVAGMSQETLAEKLNIATNTLSNIERGNAFMTSSTLEKISNIFQIEYSELFDFSTEKDCEKMYKNIITRLNLYKENPTILTYLDNITKILINN